jgi:hypothetical protein
VTLYELHGDGATSPATEDLTGILAEPGTEFGADGHEPTCIVVRIVVDGPIRARAWRLLWLRLACHRAARRLLERGVHRTRRFAVLPGLVAPFLVYELGTSAERYAADRLTLGGAGILRRLARLVSGCDPDAGAILVVGEHQ